MIPMAMAGAGIVGAGLSVLAASERNAAISKQAAENFNASLTTLDQKRSVDFAGLLYQGGELNRQVGAQLTQLGFEQRKARAQTVVKTNERNIYGATAMKLSSQVDKDAAMLEDSIVQKGEAAMSDIQTSLANANYSYNSGVYGASQNYANMMSQRQSGTEILAGAVSSGVSFASGYKTLTA